jgi:Tfp pilus assembly protein PilO
MDLNTLLTKHKNKFLNVAIIILSLILANNFYKNSVSELAKLKEQEKNEGMKTEILKTLSRLESRLNQFTASLGRKDSNYIISNINGIARETGIRISSIKPEQESKNADYIKTPFNMALKAPSYHVAGKFVSKLESSGDVFYVIDTLRMVPSSDGEGLDINLKLTSVAVAN